MSAVDDNLVGIKSVEFEVVESQDIQSIRKTNNVFTGLSGAKYSYDFSEVQEDIHSMDMWAFNKMFIQAINNFELQHKNRESIQPENQGMTLEEILEEVEKSRNES